MNYRVTQGRIDHSTGYILKNIKTQSYSGDTEQRTVERFSEPCIALVGIKADLAATLFEYPSMVNAIARIDEVFDLGVTCIMMQGNIKNGAKRITEDYSIFIVSRDKLLNMPMVVDMGIPVSNVVDDASVRYAHLPEVQERTTSVLRMQADDFGVIYVSYVEEFNKIKIYIKNNIKEVLV